MAPALYVETSKKMLARISAAAATLGMTKREFVNRALESILSSDDQSWKRLSGPRKGAK